MPEEWKESIIVSVYKKGDKTDCSNYRGILVLLTVYKILAKILLSMLTPYAEEIIGDHQCGFRRNRSTDHLFCIRQILEKKWEYNELLIKPSVFHNFLSFFVPFPIFSFPLFFLIPFICLIPLKGHIWYSGSHRLSPLLLHSDGQASLQVFCFVLLKRARHILRQPS